MVLLWVLELQLMGWEWQGQSAPELQRLDLESLAQWVLELQR